MEVRTLFSLLQDFVEYFYKTRERVKSIKDNTALLSQGISASELYDLNLELMEQILFIISGEHVHSPRKNPRVKVKKGIIAADGVNTDLIIKIRDPTNLVDVDDVEVEAVKLIMRDLISLKRHRRPARRSSIPSSSTKTTKKKKDRAQKRRRYFY